MILNRAVQRQKAREERKQHLIDELLKYGCTKMEDGRQLYEVPLADLEKLHIKVKCQFGKSMLEEE